MPIPNSSAQASSIQVENEIRLRAHARELPLSIVHSIRSPTDSSESLNLFIQMKNEQEVNGSEDRFWVHGLTSKMLCERQWAEANFNTKYVYVKWICTIKYTIAIGGQRRRKGTKSERWSASAWSMVVLMQCDEYQHWIFFTTNFFRNIFQAIWNLVGSISCCNASHCLNGISIAKRQDR